MAWLLDIDCQCIVVVTKSTLDDLTYVKLKKDPTSKIERCIANELKELEKSEEIMKQMRSRITPSYSHPSQIYGLPKIHKESIPLRPIVCTIGSPTYSLVKELAHILSPLTGQTSSYIKNSAHFVEQIREETINERDQMVSFDVQSLFTKVPIDEAIEVCQAS